MFQISLGFASYMAETRPSKLLWEWFEKLETSDPLRQRIAAIAALAESLEKKLGLSELSAKNETLTSENDVLRSELDVTNKELDRLRAEQAKREYNEKTDLPEDQFKILEVLNAQGAGRGSNIDGICLGLDGGFDVSIPKDEIVDHLNRLEALGHVEVAISAGDRVWWRSNSGNSLVIAKRRTDRTQAASETKVRRSEIEEKILIHLHPAGSELAQFGGHSVHNLSNYVGVGSKLIQSCLDNLEAIQLVETVSLPDNYSRATGWVRTDKGDEYLALHGLLK